MIKSLYEKLTANITLSESTHTESTLPTPRSRRQADILIVAVRVWERASERERERH